ncbi:MAG: hypothetical protein JW884_11010 [Deltaproteobacteria bacterium]|nr:hypothetical protein [Deltaproteobacteria bacterium]
MVKAMKHVKGDLHSVRGIILPVAWDDRGIVTDIVLSTVSEEEYYIDREGRGRELWRYIRADVEATGTVTARDNRRTMRVADYRVRRAWQNSRH